MATQSGKKSTSSKKTSKKSTSKKSTSSGGRSGSTTTKRKSTSGTSARSGSSKGRSGSGGSRSGSGRSYSSCSSSRSKQSGEQHSSFRITSTTLLVVASLLMMLYAVGVGRGAIDVEREDQLMAFSEFLLSGFGGSGADEGEIVTPATSSHVQTTTTTANPTTTAETTTTTTAKSTTTAATTTTSTARTTTTTTKAATSTAKTTTTKATTTTTKSTTTTKKTTTTAAKTTTTTAASTTAVAITTQATTVTAPTYANAANVVEPNYESPYYIVVYAGQSQSVAIYSKDEGGKYSVLSKCFTCSTGAPESPTRTGQYKIRAKYRWRLLYGPCYGQYSSSISSSYLFHSVPYIEEKANTLDMAEYDKLGTQASHGCIRLCVRDSKWIYDNCPIGTQVNIVNLSGPAGAGFPARNTDPKYNGWDPTDPSTDNPYNK